MEISTAHEQDAYDIYSQPGMLLGTNNDIITENAASPPIVRLECQNLHCFSLFFQIMTSNICIFLNEASSCLKNNLDFKRII